MALIHPEKVTAPDMERIRALARHYLWLSFPIMMGFSIRGWSTSGSLKIKPHTFRKAFLSYLQYGRTLMKVPNRRLRHGGGGGGLSHDQSDGRGGNVVEAL